MTTTRAIAHFNRLITNRVQGLWAWLLPPWAVIIHCGRRTGKEYRTPVIAWRHGHEIVVALPYGTDADWVQNLIAAGEGEYLRGGRRRRLTQPTIVPRSDHRTLPGRRRWKLFPARHVLIAQTQDGPAQMSRARRRSAPLPAPDRRETSTTLARF